MKKYFSGLYIQKLCGIIFMTIICNTLCANNLEKKLCINSWNNIGHNFTIDSIKITGNKKTKNFIIINELTFANGDTINSILLQTELDSSRQNLLNTSLFLSADISYYINTTGNLTIEISVQERWYIFPKPWFDIADRNFNVWWVEQQHNFARTEYGVDLLQYNFTGRHDDLELRAIFGYTQKLELFYHLPQLSSHTHFGAGLFIAYSQNKQINYTTFENKHLFIEDSDYLRKKFRAGIQFIYRDGIYQYNQIELKYNHHQIADTIAIKNPAYFLNGKTSQQFFSLTYTYTNNHVDNKAYPLKGYFATIQVSKIGLGIFHDINQLALSAQYNKYMRLGYNLYLQGELAAKTNFSSAQPYFTIGGLGYCENFVRGYEYYVIDGSQSYLFRSNLKSKILDFGIHVPFIHSTKFDRVPIKTYAKLFTDAGYVYDNTFEQNNPLTNTFLYSAGAGIDITTYYDWVFRIEGAVNALGEIGVYLHVALDLNTYENCNLW